MRVLFIRPPDSEAFKLFSKAGSVSMPIGIAYIAAYLKKHGHKVKIMDCLVKNYTKQEFKNYIKDFKPEIVGITTTTPTIYNAFYLANEVKKINPELKIIMGGPHVAALPEESIKNEVVDIICTGEGEQVMLELIKVIKNKRPFSEVTGIYYEEGNKVHSTGQQEFVKNLDELPFPARELLDTDAYRISATRKRTIGKADIIVTSRGCPYRCNFCSKAVFGQTVRYRSPENVVAEVEEAIKKYGVKEIQFVDDTLTVNPNHVMTICELILKKKLKFIWGCHSRVNNVTNEMFALMRKAGCRELAFGVESGNQQVLNAIGKKITLEEVERAVKMCQKHGMLALCGFIIGHIQDTKKTIEETINFACKINPDFANFSILTPLPGSEVFEIAIERGLIDNTKYDKFIPLSGEKPMAMGELAPEQLIYYQKLAYRKFYFRSRYLIRRIKNIKSFADIKQGFTGLKTIIAHQFHKYFKK